MAFQLVYTSAAKLLDAGRSGFGTVARAKTISPLLVSAIERVSQFANIRGTNRSRVIFVHRRIVAANNRFHILSRIADAGADYTGRTNHIAHHLIVSLEEVARAAARGLTPADIIRQFQWLPRWDGAARFFTAEDEVILEAFQPLGHQSARSEWSQLTGNPHHARLLAWDGAPRNGVLLMPSGADSLALLAESLAEFGTQSWSRTFTTSLETTDEMTDLDWIITSPDAFSEIQGRCGARTVLDLSRPQSLPVPPDPVQVAPEPCPAVRPARTPAAALLIPPPHVPQVQVVKVRVSSGSSSERSSPAQSTSASRKLRTQMILGGAAALIMLGVLGVAIWRTTHPAKNEKDVAATELSESQQQAVRDLKAIGVGEKDATKVASKAGDKAQEWAKFITGFISEVKKNPPNQNLDGYPQPPSTKEPEHTPAWLGSLILARASLSAYSNDSGKLIPFVKRLKAVSDITKVFKDITKEINNSNDRSGKTALNDEDCDRYDGFLAKWELEKLFKSMQGASAEEARKQLKTAITKDELHHEKFPQRYESLCEVIKNHFEEIASQKTLDVLNADKATVKQDDVAGFECAIGYWNNPETDIKDEDKTIIKKSGFVPKDFKERRPKHNAPSDRGTNIATTQTPNAKPADKSPAPDLSGIKQNEVIVVSRDELSKGVEVKLLKRLFTTISGDNLIADGLTLKYSASAVQKLISVTNEKCFSEHYLPTAVMIRLFEDGKIKMVNPNEKTITLSYKSNSDEWRSWIVVDEKYDTALVDNLEFQWREVDRDRIAIVGDLEKWILATTPQVKFERKIEPAMLGVELIPDKDVYYLQRSPQESPVITFSNQAAEKIEELKNAYKSAKDKRPESENNEDKEAKEKKVANALDALKESIESAIGGGILSKELGLSDESRIVEQEHKGEIYKTDVFKNLKLKPAGKGTDWNAEILDIKRKIGENKRDEYLKLLIGEENWDKLKGNNYDAIQNCISKLLKSTAPPVTHPDLAKELEKTKSIAISTPSGRVLFKATKK